MQITSSDYQNHLPANRKICCKACVVASSLKWEKEIY